MANEAQLRSLTVLFSFAILGLDRILRRDYRIAGAPTSAKTVLVDRC